MKNVTTATKATIKIGDDWYDLSKWAKYHPGGEPFYPLQNGRHDATESPDLTVTPPALPEIWLIY